MLKSDVKEHLMSMQQKIISEVFYHMKKLVWYLEKTDYQAKSIKATIKNSARACEKAEMT